MNLTEAVELRRAVVNLTACLQDQRETPIGRTGIRVVDANDLRLVLDYLEAQSKDGMG